MKRLIIFLIISFTLNAEDIVISGGPKENIYIQYSYPILEEAYKRLGYNPIFKFSSFEKSLIISSKGKTDGEIFRFNIVADKYPTLLLVDEPLFNIRTLAYATKKGLNISSWSDLAPYKIAYVRGIKLSEEKTKGMNVIITNTYEDAFKLLIKNRVEVVISGEFTGNSVIKNLEPNKVDFSRYVLESNPVFHLVHENRKELIPKLNKVILELKKEGFIDW